MKTRRLNVCLHDIVRTSDDINTIYDITRQQLEELVHSLQELQSKSAISSYVLFFDDGYKSALEVVQTMDLGIDNNDVHMAIITGDIDKPGRLTRNDISSLAHNGFAIDSHGVSHAALAIFVDDSLQLSPLDGRHRNSPRGKNLALSVQEIQYQFTESGKTILDVTGKQPSSFVLPYGLYNKEVVYQAANTNYQRLYTCDSSFDNGQVLAPRLMITQDNIKQLDILVDQLPDYPRLLS